MKEIEKSVNIIERRKSHKLLCGKESSPKFREKNECDKNLRIFENFFGQCHPMQQNQSTHFQ